MVGRVSHRPAINAWIAGIVSRPPAFGTNDCAVGLVLPVIKIQTGIDLGAPYRGRYSTFAEGARLLMADGYKNLADLVGKHFRERPVATAQFGDVVSLPAEHEGWALGVVIGERAYAMTETGWGTTLRSVARLAFAIE